jgi:hypothetical protein
MSEQVLAYTIAIDSPGERLYRNLAKLLASSVLRSGFDGRLIIFHNGENQLFPLGRSNIVEERIEIDVDGSIQTATSFHSEQYERRWSLKHQLSEVLIGDYEWDKLLFLDADCLVTKPLNPIFEGDWELAIYREPGQRIAEPQFNCFLTDEEMEQENVEGVNSGVFCVHRSIAERFFNAWRAAEELQVTRRRCCLDQAALNRVLLDESFVTKDIGSLVAMPFHTDRYRSDSCSATINHFVGALGQQKLRASFGLFMESYFFDPNLTLYNLIEN